MALTMVIEHHGERSLYRDGRNIAREGQGDSMAHVRYLLRLADLGVRSGTVAHIGGGFCCMARIMGPAFTHTIYEINPDCYSLVPSYCTLVKGDYRDTLDGTFDVIVYDIGDSVPHDRLTKHLTSGGIILPKE